LRHGLATQINIAFSQEEMLTVCNYSDNGCGFDASDAQNQHGLGMKNISSRISFLNGVINIHSEQNKGVQVIFKY
jgi:signal transduction histidine kinase